MFGNTIKETGEGSINLHNEERHKMCTYSNIIRVIKSKRMRWAGHAAQLEYIKLHAWEDNLKDIEYFEYVSAHG
jgi:predicted nucleotidyltransferase